MERPLLYYGRNGESLGALSDREFDIIRMQNRSFDWSAQIIPAATLTDLSKEAIDFALTSTDSPSSDATIRRWIT